MDNSVKRVSSARVVPECCRAVPEVSEIAGAFVRCRLLPKPCPSNPREIRLGHSFTISSINDKGIFRSNAIFFGFSADIYLYTNAFDYSTHVGLLSCEIVPFAVSIRSL